MLQQIKNNLASIPGWSTRRKLLVIESDDWGSIRMPSRQALQRLIDGGIPLGKCPYSNNDTLEDASDLAALGEVLGRHRDQSGNPARLTANVITANPDFARIRAANQSAYYWEPFDETYRRYGYAGMKQAWQAVIADGVIQPQLHGREHLNITRWMRQLKQEGAAARQAFEQEVFGLGFHMTSAKNDNLMRALDYDEPSTVEGHSSILKDAMSIFEDAFGFKSRSFIAPAYVWSRRHEDILSQLGVQYLQGKRKQIIPKPGTNGYDSRLHFTGMRNRQGQIYLVRNVFFEPAIYPKRDWQADALDRIKTAFRWGKPAIVGSHRLNFIGGLNPENRRKNLQLLDSLLNEILQRWPDTEFVSSDELGDIIRGRK